MKSDDSLQQPIKSTETSRPKSEAYSTTPKTDTTSTKQSDAKTEDNPEKQYDDFKKKGNAFVQKVSVWKI